MCLYLVGGPTHVLVRHTSLLAAELINPERGMMEPQCYELVPCPNQLRIKGSFTEQEQGADSNVF